MLNDDEITFHIRTVVESGDNPDKQDDADESLALLSQALQECRTAQSEGRECTNECSRVNNFLTWVNGGEVSISNDPWIVVALIVMNYENNASGSLNLMPNIHGIHLIREWNGATGPEPEWLIELDKILTKHVYISALSEFGYSDRDISQFLHLSPKERADKIGSELYSMF